MGARKQKIDRSGELAWVIRGYMRAHDMTQDYLAHRLKVSRQAVSAQLKSMELGNVSLAAVQLTCNLIGLPDEEYARALIAAKKREREELGLE